MIRKIIIGFALFGSLIFIVLAGKEYMLQQAEAQIFSELAALKNQVIITAPNQNSNSLNTEDDNLAKQTNEPASIIDFAALNQINSDIQAWISIADTVIDYPIMFTPNDIEYYLRRDINQESSNSGVPFVGAGGSINPLSDNLVIHAHNLQNDTMFGTLENYLEPTYYNDHKYIDFYTPQQDYSFEIIAVLLVDVTVGNGHFEFYNYLDWAEDDVNIFSQTVAAMSVHPLEADITEQDKLLTLSTCSYHADNGRTVIIAKMIDNN